MNLSDRKMRILKAIIDDYIATGIPVGSRTLSKQQGFDYSPATIRNEMADLEEMGYLEKSHVSSGRAPSDLAYRFYVDRMMQLSSVTPEEVAMIKKYFNTKVNALEQVMDMTAKVLSDATHHISVVMRPQIDEIKLKRVQLIKITDTKALVILVTNGGIIKDTVINIPQNIEDNELEMLSNVLTEATKNKSLSSAMKEISIKIRDAAQSHKEVAEEVFSAMGEHAKQNKDIVLGGVGNFLDYPQYNERNKARDFLNVLETKDKLYSMLNSTADMEFSIRIGRENEYDEFKDMSIVTATYKVGGEKVGSYGIIGPTRMDYSKVVSVLHYVGRNLNEILSCFLQDDSTKK